MKLGDEQKIKSQFLNEEYQKRIDEIGIEKFLKEMRDAIKKHNIPLIKESYEFLKKDMKLAPQVGMVDEGTTSLINTIRGNQNDLPIFEIEDDDIEYKINFPIIPFNKFYIATSICERIDNELYTIGGFFVLDYSKDFLLVIFYYSRTPSDGWAFSSFMTKKEGLLKKIEKQKFGDLIELSELRKKINLMAMKKFSNLMKKLIYKINKKEYTTYKKYSYGNYIEKRIVFAYDVRSHKRHFWEDSGRFNIPLMSKEEWEREGYQTDELVFKDGVLRRDVPFTIIGEFRIGEVKKEEHKVYDLIEKKQFRQEEKLFKILREIFPNEFIKRHDRKKLKGLELDFFIHKLNLGFEYDGEQHFDKKLCEEVFHSNFYDLQQRDKKKNHLCRNKNITLIRIKYNEPLNKRYIKKKLKENGIEC